MYNGGYLISQIHKLTGRKINELLKEANVIEFNCSQGIILSVLWGKGNQSIKEIGKTTGLAKTSLTSMLDRMEKQDLIQKVENKEDGRSTIICLTEKSKALEKVYQKITDEMVIQYYNGFNEDEIRIFESTLERVVKNLEGTNNESSMELSGLENLEVLQIY